MVGQSLLLRDLCAAHGVRAPPKQRGIRHLLLQRQRQLFLPGVDAEAVQVLRRGQGEGGESLIREEQGEQRYMRAEQEARLVRDVGDSKLVPVPFVSIHSMAEERSPRDVGTKRRTHLSHRGSLWYD